MAEAICRIVTMTPSERATMGACGRHYYDVSMGFERALDETIDVIIEAAECHTSDKGKI
jgi:hypothetical protein